MEILELASPFKLRVQPAKPIRAMDRNEASYRSLQPPVKPGCRSLRAAGATPQLCTAVLEQVEGATIQPSWSASLHIESLFPPIQALLRD
jgi:hypothetical protein